MGDLLMHPIFLANFSVRVCSFSNGESAGWSSSHSSRCGIGFGGDAALFESRFLPFVKGGLRGQGVRLEWSNEHTRAHPSVFAKGMSASHPHHPLSPSPVRLPPFPADP